MDIGVSFSRLFEFLRIYIPMDAMLLQRLSPGSNVIQQIAASYSDGRTALDDIFLSEESSEFFAKGVFNFKKSRVCVVDRSEKLPSDYRNQLDIKPGASVLAMGLTPEDNYLGAVVVLAKRGKLLTSEHIGAFEMLHEPLSIALANALSDCVPSRIGNIEQETGWIFGAMQLDEDSPAAPLNPDVLNSVEVVSGTDAPVLLVGEIGVGKGAIARRIHNMSTRANKPFVALDCSVIPTRMIDYYLLGHEKNAIPGTEDKRRGPLELANLGTLYLANIDELPPEIQVQLLNAIRTKKICRLGGTKVIPADVRIIASSRRNLIEAVTEGRLLVELWYALSVFPIFIPPLRDRPNDVMPLIRLSIERYSAQLCPGRNPVVADDAPRRLLEHSWPGNERELENLVKRELVKATDGVLRFEETSALANPVPASKKPAASSPESPAKPEPEAGGSLLLDDVIAEHIRKVLAMTQGRIKGPGGAAELLGVNPSTLRGKMAKLGIQHKS
ncbi:MAG: sigma-54-dependent transcriptional regulator [Coriobacteriales bacterium]